MAKNNHGHFLIIASQTGYMATAGVVDYAATKSAAVAIYEGLHTKMKNFYNAPSVRISCISPSAAKTKMFDGIKTEGNFLTPMLTPEYLGESIAKTLLEGIAVNVMTPATAYISAPSRVLPEWMRVGMQDGGADMMTALTPHQPLN
ncbi:hypothetical protein N431DRAFT_440710 [Stipitochalara longipes BDJ]|nr:hypothetical protein N431DRAFT_440710 [Stipitochalara longipes BDJ]